MPRPARNSIVYIHCLRRSDDSIDVAYVRKQEPTQVHHAMVELQTCPQVRYRLGYFFAWVTISVGIVLCARFLYSP